MLRHCFILILLLTVLPATAQVKVGDHYGFVDQDRQRVIVALPADEMLTAELPDVYHHGGVPCTVERTTLPLVRINHGPLDNRDYRAGLFTLIDPEAQGEARVTSLPAEYRYRGGSSLVYTKKNYAVRLFDPATGMAPSERPLLGMRSDNSWILDAMAADHSRMRNRVSTDLWLDFSTPPHYAADDPRVVNGTHGRFVEVFDADRYWGIYCLTEKVDRKQLRLKKYGDDGPRGVLYKSTTHDNLRTLSSVPDDASFTWQGWEMQYPDVRKGEPGTWAALHDLASFLAPDAPDAAVAEEMATRVDQPLWLDYNLYVDLLHADDNAMKNIFVYWRDMTDPEALACVCPWDLDATWGRTWDNHLWTPDCNCVIANGVNYHTLLSLPDGQALNDARWAELRQEAFTEEHIWPYFERYARLFRESGADRREAERWSGIDGMELDIPAEMDYIRSWIGRRIAWLDFDYGYDPVSVAPLAGASAPSRASLPVVSLSGTVVAHVSSPREVSSLSLPSGLYTVGGRKVLVR